MCSLREFHKGFLSQTPELAGHGSYATLSQDGLHTAAGAPAQEAAVQDAAAIAGEPVQIANDSQFHGFLERVPGSWLHHWIRSLPSSSKAALFGCSKAYAKHVLQSAPGVTLVLARAKELTAQQAGVRKDIITALLSGRRGFAVHLEPSAGQLFPTLLAGQVVSLKLVDLTDRYKPWTWEYTVTATGCPWAAMTNLQSLCTKQHDLHPEDLSGLLGAVDAGQLRQLRTLVVASIKDTERFARTLGPQLQSLTCTDAGVVRGKLSLFTALQRFTTHRAYESVWKLHTIIEELSQHPNLRHVTLCSVNFAREFDFSRLSCRWESLTLRGLALEALLRLPLASVQQITIEDGVGCGAYPVYDGQVVRDALTELAHKIVCRSSTTSEFELTNLRTTAVIPLLQKLQGVTTVVLSGMCKVSPQFATHILQAMPSCVKSIRIDETYTLHGEHLWQGWPEHIPDCTFHKCFYAHTSSDKLCSLMRSIPSHVHNVTLLARDKYVVDAWLETGLRAQAPGHVQVTFGWDVPHRDKPTSIQYC